MYNVRTSKAALSNYDIKNIRMDFCCLLWESMHTVNLVNFELSLSHTAQTVCSVLTRRSSWPARQCARDRFVRLISKEYTNVHMSRLVQGCGKLVFFDRDLKLVHQVDASDTVRGSITNWYVTLGYRKMLYLTERIKRCPNSWDLLIWI